MLSGRGCRAGHFCRRLACTLTSCDCGVKDAQPVIVKASASVHRPLHDPIDFLNDGDIANLFLGLGIFVSHGSVVTALDLLYPVSGLDARALQLGGVVSPALRLPASTKPD